MTTIPGTSVPGTSLLSAADAKALCVRSMDIMVNGSLADFEAVLHPDAVNHEAGNEPPASRGRGPAAFHATALWLREMFGDFTFEVHQVIVDGDLVALHDSMSGRHVGTAVMYDAEARVARAFPPTGRPFASTQTHWFRLRDGKVVEHWANRDDLGTATQLGWAPPSPAYLLRTALATRRARRAASR